MKIIHITDTHILGAERANVYGIDVALRLKKAIKSINKYHHDADFTIITGDLVDVATPESYKLLKEIIGKSKVPVYLILGNHDNREYFNKYFPEFSNGKFVQYTKEIHNKSFIFLDTLIENERYGMLCEDRLQWLEKQLSKNNNPTYLFMHHHPIDSGLYEMDYLADFRSQTKFWDLVKKHSNIKHITFGHLHRILHATQDGVSMHSTRSTTFQVSYQPDTKLEYLTNKEMPTYAIMEIDNKGSVRINHHEYVDERVFYEDGNRFDN